MACAPRVTPPSLLLTDGDRTSATDPRRPALPPLTAQPFKATAAEERKFMWLTYVQPLMGFTLEQEATTAAERLRANGVVAKVDAHQVATAPRPWWRLRR